jgi:hypothetical protein
MRYRSGADLIDDVYKKADLEAFTARYPRPEVLRHINQGGAELWDLILNARGRTWGRAPTPWTITTVDGRVEYTSVDGFPSTVLELLSVRMSGPCGGDFMLSPLQPPEEAWWRAPLGRYIPEFYELVPGALILLPTPKACLTVVVEYVRAFTDLTDSSSSFFDGVNGWEDYLVCHGAQQLAFKEGELPFAREMQDEKDRLAVRIAKRAPSRDGYRAQRARDVRGEKRMWGFGPRWGR